MEKNKQEPETFLNGNGKEKLNLGEKYFKERMQLYGITDKINKVRLWRTDPEKPGENILVPLKIFEPCEKGISILVYDLDRLLITYKGDDSRMKKDYKLIRYHTPQIDGKGKEHKYHIPKGAGSYPFFPPGLIDKYEKNEKIKTLVLTEGYFKAFKAAMHGLDIIGLSSITHYKDKEKGTLHSDIIKLIRQCQVENVIWLADADCNQISLKALEAADDIYKRPNQFFNSCVAIKRLLDDYDVHKYFAYVNPPAPPPMDGELPPTLPKGLDDLLIALPGKEKEIIEDLLQVSKPGEYYWREDMSYSTSKIHKHFCLHDINVFVEFHSEAVPDLKKKEFFFNGTKWKWNEEKSICEIIVPADAKKYFRVGDHYYEKIEIPNKLGELEKTFHRRMKQTIIDDFGKNFVNHIPKYKAFCNVPDHTNYQEIIHSCYNMYFPFEHEPNEGEYFYTISFLKHIFGDKEVKVKHKTKGEIAVTELDIGLDYLQLLYQNPQQTLPILCLVSKENNTGKTTFANWMKQLFTQNVAIVGNAELANDFNASWAGKLLVICEEAKIDKTVVVEKVKALSTGTKIFMNAKGKDHIEIDFFAKFIFNTNNEENFIYAGEDDVRYWIRKVPVIEDLFVNMLELMKEEMPAFLDYLNKRKLKTEQLHRAWFYPELIKTDALKKVIAFSRSTVEKEMRQHIRDMFFDHGVSEILMTPDDINETFMKRKYEKNYLRHVLEDSLKVEQYHIWTYEGKEYDTSDMAKAAAGEGFDSTRLRKLHKVKRYAYPKWERISETGKMKVERIYVSCHGRPYVFKIEKFLLKEEIEGRWLDPEAVQEAKMHEHPEDKSWGQTADAGENGKGKQEDLPF